MKKFALLCASTAFVMPGMALAQSTGSIAVEEEAIVVTGTRTRDINGISVPNTAKAQGVLNSGVDRAPGPRPVDPPDHEPGSRRQLHQLGSLWLVGRQPPHPRLRRQPHLADLRRHPAERQRQLCDLLEPADGSGTDRAGQRQPRPDRHRQPDRLGGRRHRQLSHDPARPRLGVRVVRLDRRGRLSPRLHPVVTPASGGRTARAPSSPIRTRATTCSAARARSTSSSSTRASIIRWAAMATSSRSPATTTATATISTATRRSTICAPPRFPTADPASWARPSSPPLGRPAPS